MAFTVGDVVAARYEVLESLGQRPLGWLYRAREREIGVEVALWVIGGAMLPDETARSAFVAKLGRAKTLSHPNLVRVFGIYPTADEVVIAAQWAPGQTLFARVQEKPLGVDEARPILAQVARAMTHAHQHGVVLGDVHTATVTLLAGTAKLSNIGIAPALPRKRFLEAVRDTQGYQKLPPERQRQIQQRFERYQALSPEQRERMDRNLERWRSMTPEERQRAREQIRQRRQERQRELRPRPDAPVRRPR